MSAACLMHFNTVGVQRSTPSSGVIPRETRALALCVEAKDAVPCSRQVCNKYCRTGLFLPTSCKLSRRNYSSPSITPTIFGLSTAFGRSAIAVIRVSGPSADRVSLRMTKCRKAVQPRVAHLTKICDPIAGDVLDKSLVVWFPGPKSYTGEDMCEMYVHGGPAVITSILKALSKLHLFRPAEPGEFTRRAFLNGKMDLTEVEGLSDLLQAETEEQRRQAFRQMDGDLHQLYSEWRKKLKKCLANVEAFIDFSEDDNIEDNILDIVTSQLEELLQEVARHLTDKRRGQRLRSGVRAVILGKPNAGKSSLLNLLSRKDVAIVSPIAGTTRDILESPIDICGYPVLLYDTAGIRATEDAIEKEGVRRARARISESDLLIVVVDAVSIVDETGNLSSKKLVESIDSMTSKTDDDTANEQSFCETVAVINKVDLLTQEQSQNIQLKNVQSSFCLVSCKTEEGFDEFLKVLHKKLEHLCGNPRTESVLLTQERHRHHLTLCKRYLEEYFPLKDVDTVMAAEALRQAAVHLGKVTGKITSEEILDIVFKDFCIGK